MLPVLSPTEMAAFDAAAPVSVGELIERAGWVVAHAARDLLGGTYGRRVAVLVGGGNNGADGLVAARWMERWGCRCERFGLGALPAHVRGFDLVIDAALGTGLSRPYVAPEVGETPVLAVDIPSGVDGLTGEVPGRALTATRTVTFVAAKPGLLMGPGADLVGELWIEPLGLDRPASTCQWVERTDVVNDWPSHPVDAHKWSSAVWVIGGAEGMFGAPTLAAEAASRAGAGMVLVSVPSDDDGAAGKGLPIQVVQRPLGRSWADDVLAEASRVGALVVGPGLLAASSPSPGQDNASAVIARWPGPLVVDASGLDAVAANPAAVQSRAVPAVLTPHAGEFIRLGGSIETDRVASVRRLADDLRSVVLLKGPTTVVAEPDGQAWVVTAGDPRLATAGTGDVLAGIVGAGLAQGLTPGAAAALGAELHGQAARQGPRVGLTAADLPRLVSRWLGG